MGKFDGKQITGLVGDLVFKKSADGKTTIVQTKQKHVPQTEGSKKTASVMGNASSLSAAIRADLHGLTDAFYQGEMINRLTKSNQAILSHCFDKNTETYTFKQNSFENLAGFELNSKSPLSTYLWVKPQLTLEGNILTLTIPAFEVPDQLKMPKEANAFEIVVRMGEYALHSSKRNTKKIHSESIAPEETHVPEQQISFQVAHGCLCVVGIAIKYFNLAQGTKKPLNHKDMNPAAIVDAIYIPGEFVLPPTGSTPNRAIGSSWREMMKVNLPPAQIKIPD
ncbi:hypothetical protein [Pedobacter sp. GR22-6]|uniref:hypothetical protein n=1 Tax=Pedobacter sp. GR22-6 TaxID=3127957 RepID=UPI00307FC199